MEFKGVVKKIMGSDELKAKLQNLGSFDEVYEFFVATGYEGGKSELKDKLFKNSAHFGTLTGDDLMHVSGGISGRRAFLACSGLMILMGLLPATNLEKVKYFIKQGADVNLGLWYAVRSFDNLDLVKCFVENGANVNIKWWNGWTLLHCSQNEQMIDYLISHGADVNAKDDFGQAPLHFACQGENIKWVKYLLEHGADVNIKDRNGNVPLHSLVVDASLYEQGMRDVGESATEMMDLLIEKGADVNAENYQGKVLLDTAAGYGGVSVFKYLVEHGADINTEDNDGKSLRSRVCEYLHEHRRIGNGNKICENVQKILEYIYTHEEEKQLR